VCELVKTALLNGMPLEIRSNASSTDQISIQNRKEMLGDEIKFAGRVSLLVTGEKFAGPQDTREEVAVCSIFQLRLKKGMNIS
jgi:hypothetical protein